MTNEIIQRALISVSDKSHLMKVVEKLHAFKVEIICSSGTSRFIKENLGENFPLVPVETLTGHSEAFQGRMKTLSFEIGSSLLYRRDDERDQKEAERLGLRPIDVVICNLYPFAEKVSQKHTAHELIDWIDIGGPMMLRAAAKNFRHVCVLPDPQFYDEFLEELQQLDGAVSFSFRQKMMRETFQLTAQYDALIAKTFSSHDQANKEIFLRYGENPHQKAKLYLDGERDLLQQIKSGKELSYNNLVDADAAWRCTEDLKLIDPSLQAVAIIKHANPCGAALGADQLSVLQSAWETDPVSSFGGIISFSHEVTEESARWLHDKFIEVIVAPSFSKKSLTLLASKKNLRTLQFPHHPDGELMTKKIILGTLQQEEEKGLDDETEWTCPTQQKIPSDQYPLIHFGIMVTKHLKSNAVSFVYENKEKSLLQLISTGCGQTNRVEALELLLLPKLKQKARGDVIAKGILISDAFFPFADSIHIAAQAGIKQIVQPGGSMRDAEVIATCDHYHMAMMITGKRHFRH